VQQFIGLLIYKLIDIIPNPLVTLILLSDPVSNLMDHTKLFNPQAEPKINKSTKK